MRIKYMGTSDVRRLEKGETFNGQLSDELALPVDLQWDDDNHFVINTDDDKFSDVDDEFWTLLLEEGEFKDVSDLKRIPPSEGQKLWRGMKESAPNPEVAPEGVAGNVTDKRGGQASPGDAPTTTTGGSTGGGTTGGTTGGRGRRST